MINYIVTDMDGTLFDNREANAESYVRAFADVGSPIQHADYRQYFGLRFDSLVKALAPHLNEEGRLLLRDRKKHHYRQAVTMVKTNDPLINFLRTMHATVPMGLATTSSRHNAEFLLSYFGIADLFKIILYGEDVTHGKPHPECYTTCIKALGGRPEETLIFEDSPSGIQAATAAGAQVVRINLHEA